MGLGQNIVDVSDPWYLRITSEFHFLFLIVPSSSLEYAYLGSWMHLQDYLTLVHFSRGGYDWKNIRKRWKG